MQMRPVSRCLQKVDYLYAVPDSTAADKINAALDELDGAYREPCERIVALGTVLQEVRYDRRRGGAPFAALSV